MGFMFVPHVVINLLSVLGMGFCCCKPIVCHYLHCVNGVYVCSSCCDKAAVCFVPGEGVCCYKFIVCYNLHCVNGVYVCSSCRDKAAVFLVGGSVVVSSLFVIASIV